MQCEEDNNGAVVYDEGEVLSQPEATGHSGDGATTGRGHGGCIKQPAPPAGYIFGPTLGKGTYGQVVQALKLASQEHVAVKIINISNDKEGVPSTAIREVSLLKSCEHPNIIKLLEVIYTGKHLYLVFEYMDMDLKAYLRDGPITDHCRLRHMSMQLFRGVEFCHKHFILHRDLKPQNLLINPDERTLKLADFGLARAFHMPLQPYTHDVVTLWYRPPEILLGQLHYATPMDIWSCGCVLAEMATARPLFPGDSEIGTIYEIFLKLGTPKNQNWPGVEKLPFYSISFPQWHESLESILHSGPGLGEDGIDLIRHCLSYHPVARPSASVCLQHTFFDIYTEVRGVLIDIYTELSRIPSKTPSEQDSIAATVPQLHHGQRETETLLYTDLSRIPSKTPLEQDSIAATVPQLHHGQRESEMLLHDELESETRQCYICGKITRTPQRATDPQCILACLAPPAGVAVELSTPGLATELVVEGEVSIEPGVEIIAPTELGIEGEEIFIESEIEVVKEEGGLESSVAVVSFA